MICIRKAELFQLGDYINIDTDIFNLIEKDLHKDGEFFLFDKSAASRFKILDYKSLPGDKVKPGRTSLKVLEIRRSGIGMHIYDCLFFQNIFFNTSLITAQKLISFEEARKKRTVISIKLKQDSYARFIFYREFDNVLIESYIQWGEWSKIQSELLSLKDEINISIKNNETERIDEIKNIIKDITSELFKKLGLPVDFSDGRDTVALIDIYLSGKTVYLPLEIFDSLLVHYFVPSSVKGCSICGGSGKNNRLTLIYSAGMPDSSSEIYAIKNILDKNYNIEIFTGENYDEYKFNARNSCYFHYSGHGKIIAENGSPAKGMIELNSRFTDRILYSGRLAFLNCCDTGLLPDGIIGNLIDNGTDNVIASPYEISGEKRDYTDLTDFYSFLPGGDVNISFCLNSIKNPDFSLFYRLYGRYCPKI